MNVHENALVSFNHFASQVEDPQSVSLDKTTLIELGVSQLLKAITFLNLTSDYPLQNYTSGSYDSESNLFHPKYLASERVRPTLERVEETAEELLTSDYLRESLLYYQLISKEQVTRLRQTYFLYYK